jgi:2-succinyl-5-enolpyruvyl-6-hydroxy-3-cyclohexene-1-carboxylate synthase
VTDAIEVERDAERPEDVQATFCATLVDEWARCGVVHAVVSPGSRSTPLALALASDDRIAVHVHHDERSAGFVALGIGAASGHPAVVLTTSGTAAAELHPAVVEAHQGSVPLVVATADRPPELQQVGAPQTIDQVHLFSRAVRWFAEPGVPSASGRHAWRSLAARSVAEATTGPLGPGPVHLNLAFREPLVGTPGVLPAGRADDRRFHTTVGARGVLDPAGIERLAALLQGDRGLIVAGAGCGDPELVLTLARHAGWPVVADSRSGCRIDDPLAICAADAVLRHDPTAARLRPEVVVHLGAPPASKVLEQRLGEWSAVEVSVDRHGRWFDPGHRRAHVLHADPSAVTAELVAIVGHRTPEREAWSAAWTAAESAAQAAIALVLDRQDELTEPGAARAVVAALPIGATLMVSSSMPIRDLEWYGGVQGDLRVLANRGANGIDGVVSTAVGAALADAAVGLPTVVLVGDVAFLHDSNALLGLAARCVDLTIVVIDNDGGGIFSFLPQADLLDDHRFEQLFGTPHGVDLVGIAAAHGIVTVEPATAHDLPTAVAASVGAGGVRVVRVPTDRRANVVMHQELHAAVAAALGELPATP